MSKTHHERCCICNKVSSRDIETNAEDFTKRKFVPDPSLPIRLICETCKESIEELQLEYEKNDDIYGWYNPPEEILLELEEEESEIE